MSRAFRQVRRNRERRNKAMAEHPEIRFIYSVLVQIFEARKAGNVDHLEAVLTTVDKFVGDFVDEGKKEAV